MGTLNAAQPSTAAIRPAVVDDLPAIAAIVEAAYRPYVARIGREPGPMLDDYAALVGAGRVHVAEHGVVCGLIVLIPEGATMLLDNVAVHPDHHGQGIGGRLLGFAEETARAASCAAIRLYTHELMAENFARYRRLGYVEMHRAEEKGLRRVFMRKPL